MSAALRTCPECGATDRVGSRTTRPFTRLCRPCANRHIAATMRHRLSEWGRMGAVANTERQASIDDMAVERLLARSIIRTTRAERQVAVEYLTRHGHSAQEIADRIGVTKRSVARLRARIRESA